MSDMMLLAVSFSLFVLMLTQLLLIHHVRNMTKAMNYNTEVTAMAMRAIQSIDKVDPNQYFN